MCIKYRVAQKKNPPPPPAAASQEQRENKKKELPGYIETAGINIRRARARKKNTHYRSVSFKFGYFH
jgi:hypothetical protein